ncbi:integrase family protein [Fibrella aestuarina BUZ 2]|uniref:Integrase family protein n=1 Tax=Fibrella aestuarina BUZ 2 TaxID=1166018 RepID=I0K6C0_9BACT|nr:phage integrase N-terminal SAM-like domain-containing protein [Fibrella aestuarina]CCG99673.1 integrase family protein [Fibrella aestuarina BUZ 2]
MITICLDERDPALLTISFSQDPVGNDLIRNVPGRRWSYSRRCWTVPNTRASVVKVGQLFGKDYCRFDEAIVRLYKLAATTAEVEQATNPPWPGRGTAPLHVRSLHKPFRYAPLANEFDTHPVIVAVTQALCVQHYSRKTYKNYKQALVSLIRYAQPKDIADFEKVDYQKYLLFLRDRKRLGAATINVHINRSGGPAGSSTRRRF